MVRLGLVAVDDNSSSEGESDGEVVRMQAPTEKDDMNESQSRASSHSVVYSPGGLFASPTDMAIDERQRGVLGGRDTMGLAAQLGLGAEATSRTVSVVTSARSPSAGVRNERRRLSGSTQRRSRQRRSRRSLLVEARYVDAPGRLADGDTETRKILEAAHVALGGVRSKSSSRDYGLFMGRGFRASVSADGRVARPVVGGQRVAIKAAHVAPVPEHALAIALKRLEPGLGPFPFRAHTPTMRALASIAVDYTSAYSNYGDSVLARQWDLVVALWFSAAQSEESPRSFEEDSVTGVPPTASLSGSSSPSASCRTDASARDTRYEAVCAWLEREASLESTGRQDDGELADAAPLAVVYRDAASRLCRRDLDGAAERCIEGGELRLALAIASREASEARQAVDLAFDHASNRATDAGRALLARALGLTAGRLELEDQIYLEQADDAADKLGWTARLGLHVWYERRGSAPLSTALDAYRACAFEKKCASPPSAAGKQELARAYRLLELARRDAAARGKYGDHADALSSEPLEAVYARCLSPFAIPGRLAGDLAASWHLHLVLDALGLNSRERNAGLRAKLADGFIFQLVADRKADWALMVVAASFPDRDVRARVAKNILDRRLYARDSGFRDDLVAALDPPHAWFEASDALLAGVTGPPSAHAAALIGARHFRKAHRALLAADQPARAVFADRDLLRPVLETLEEHLAAQDDNDWQLGAGLYLDFLRFQDDAGPDRVCVAQALRDRLEKTAPVVTFKPPLLASGNHAHLPHLKPAYVQHLATKLAKDQLDHVHNTPDLTLLENLSRSVAIAPNARLAILDSIALDLLDSEVSHSM